MNIHHYLTLPNRLSLIRLIISPLVLPILVVYVMPHNYLILNIIIAVIFLGFSFTDFLDGYFARKYRLTSKIGSALDHIADKFLTYSTFIALLTVGKIYFFWVIIFIGRDLFVMGLRQIALENSFSIAVDYLGKVKTTLQMILITWLIAKPMHAQLSGYLYFLESGLLLITIGVTIASCYQYYLSCVKQIDRVSLSGQEQI